MSNYLKIAEKAKPKKTDEPAPPARPNRQISAATKETKATKAPTTTNVQKNLPCDQSDQSDKRVTNFTPLTVSEALAEINRRGSGAGKNTELYRRGELSEETAVEYVTCSILHIWGESFNVWKRNAPAVRKALALCIHELPPAECNVCNGNAKKLIEKGA